MTGPTYSLVPTREQADQLFRLVGIGELTIAELPSTAAMDGFPLRWTTPRSCGGISRP